VSDDENAHVAAAAEPAKLPRKQSWAFLQMEDWIVVGWVMAIKVLVFVLAVKSYPVFWDKYLKSPRQWLDIWNHWDSVHYQQIAQFGYAPTGVTKSFYPLFPWCIRLVHYVTGSYLGAGFIVSGIASVIAAVVLRRLVQLDYAADVALRSVWFFLIFPTAYFLHIGYSESLFLALALGCILAARVERWWLAGVIGAFCWMSRAPGAVLVPTLAVEAAQQYWVRRRSCSPGRAGPLSAAQPPEVDGPQVRTPDRFVPGRTAGYSALPAARSSWNWQWLWIAIVPAGFAVYLLINWHVAGDPFAFLQTRKTLFVQSFAPPWHGIREGILNMRRNPNQAEMIGAQEVYFAALGLICTIIGWIKLRPLYAMWMTGSWLLFTSVTFLQSVPRYTLTMFPIFILFALLGRNRFWNGVLTMWSLGWLTFFTILFARGWWAF
jgi:hypothetical protein